MEKLSNSPAELKPGYEIAVIGSGYGGGIAASRLSRAGRSVAVFERGREISPANIRTTRLRSHEEVQADILGRASAPIPPCSTCAFTKTCNVIVGCGLGGTSLINANISLRPEPRIFDDPASGPKDLRRI